jgi:hypothetical protein
MEKNRERSDKIRTVVSRLLAVLALVALFSWPGSAAIKRFTDEKGTLYITNEGPESTSQTTTSIPPGRPSKIRGSRAFPGPVTDPQAPPYVEPPEPLRPAPAPEPENTGQKPEEPPE